MPAPTKPAFKVPFPRQATFLAAVAGLGILLLYISAQTHSEQLIPRRLTAQADTLGTDLGGAPNLTRGGSEQQRRQQGSGGGTAGGEVLVEGGNVTLPAQSADAVACTMRAVNSSAGAHGLLEKTGSLDLKAWHENHTSFRNTRFFSWVKRKKVHPYSIHRIEVGKTGGVMVSPPPLFPYCRVFVNHKYKVIYLRSPKAGSTTILNFFGSCGHASQGGDKPTCLEPLTVDDPSGYDEMWRSYFVFGFSRNPWARAVSSYRMLVRHMLPHAECATAATWDDFCTDPSSFGRLHREYPQCAALPQYGEGFAYHHTISQEPCYVDAGSKGWVADYIGRMEYFEEDLEALLHHLEAHRGKVAPDTEPLQPEKARTVKNVNGMGCIEVSRDGKLRAKEQYCDVSEYFTGRHAACFASIRHFYQADVANLKFDNC